MTWNPLNLPVCAICGHVQGDHQSNGSGWPHPLRFGLCRVEGCGCTEFREAEPEQAAA